VDGLTIDDARSYLREAARANFLAFCASSEEVLPRQYCSKSGPYLIVLSHTFGSPDFVVPIRHISTSFLASNPKSLAARETASSI
jgi:hypothetical protein